MEAPRRADRDLRTRSKQHVGREGGTKKALAGLEASPAHEYGSTYSTTATLAAYLAVRVPAEDEDGAVGRGRCEAEPRVGQRAHLVRVRVRVRARARARARVGVRARARARARARGGSDSGLTGTHAPVAGVNCSTPWMGTWLTGIAIVNMRAARLQHAVLRHLVDMQGRAGVCVVGHLVDVTA